MTSTLIPTPAPADGLSLKMEKFCTAYLDNGGDANAAWKASYDASGMSSGSVRVAAWRMMRMPKVARRLNELRALVAERTTISVRQQMLDLAEQVSVNVADLWKLEHRPCPACLKLYDLDVLAARPLPDDLTAIPPHPDCRAAVQAHQRAVMVPMDQWPPAAKRLYEGTTVDKDGTIRPVFGNRTLMRDQLLKTLGAYVSKSENVNLNLSANVNAENLTPATAAALSPADLVRLLWKPPAEPVVAEQGARTP
jgi:hypothetical protein